MNTIHQFKRCNLMTEYTKDWIDDKKYFFLPGRGDMVFISQHSLRFNLRCLHCVVRIHDCSTRFFIVFLPLLFKLLESIRTTQRRGKCVINCFVKYTKSSNFLIKLIYSTLTKGTVVAKNSDMNSRP